MQNPYRTPIAPQTTRPKAGVDMLSKRKFYKTVFTTTVLSEESLEGKRFSAQDIHHMITEGEFSGDHSKLSENVLNGKEAADALKEQGSDPGFFCLTDEGEDSEDYEDYLYSEPSEPYHAEMQEEAERFVERNEFTNERNFIGDIIANH